jgi:hypothetical protein
MHPFQVWQEFRLPQPSFQQFRFKTYSSGNPSGSFGRKTTDRFKVPAFQPVLACEPDSSWSDPEEAFHTARRLHLEEQNLMEAEHWYRIAASENHPDACFHLGFLYETHFRDMAQARFFYEKAIDGGNSFASNNLALLIWTESGPIHEVEKLLKDSLASGNGLSAGALVLFYEATNNLSEMKQTASGFLRNLSDEDTHNRALGIVLDCLLRQNEETLLRSLFLSPGSILMKKAQPYWHVLEIIRKAKEED